MSERCFRLWFRLHARDAFLIWCSGTEDGVLVDSARQVPWFSNTLELERFARERGMALEAEAPLLHDLDKVADWLAHGSSPLLDGEALLAAWNLFDDVSRSVGGNFDEDRSVTDPVYQKLFYGGTTANQVLRPQDEPEYLPTWSLDEVNLLRSTLGKGLFIFRQVLVPMSFDGATPAGQ
ncbi:hypothetical protein ACVC7V_16725 [Hydrogenophaga sp. A37]|uniref:hypothetical protein n=1 Tax=Hydrogenophaga sp. A37 TaxID=1945864 RepID=UPI001179E6C4|nr:hypothetical protein [Hydrogenophaga sp. A37]